MFARFVAYVFALAAVVLGVSAMVELSVAW